jgi:hypothetical protein
MTYIPLKWREAEKWTKLQIRVEYHIKLPENACILLANHYNSDKTSTE